MVLGSLSFPESGTDGIVIGLTLADRLGSVVGDSIVVVSPAGADEAVLQFSQPLVRRFKIVGIYESNNKDYDAYYAYATLGSAQRLFEMGTDVNGVDVRLHDLDDVEDLKSFLVEKFSSRFRIMTWYDLHRDLYSVMMIERWIAYVILSLIIGIASFNLLGSLTMSVIEKTRDIGVLVSMGATRKMIMGIFMWQGLFVGLAGSVLGIILGVLVVYLQQEYHLAPLDPTVYIIPAIPVELRISDLITIPLTALALCAVAALYPARRAANLAPVDAIRWE
jgi:lipoprotein-releasing system permease protein